MYRELVRRTWPFVLAAVVPAVAVGVVLALPSQQNDFVLPVDGTGTSTTVELRSAAPVPAQARPTVVVAGVDAAAAAAQASAIVALGYADVTTAMALVPGPAVYFHDGFATEAAQLVDALALGVTPKLLTVAVTDADVDGDLIVVLGR